jgi:alpha-tubulin suppressor-like RCC1 family protein
MIGAAHLMVRGASGPAQPVGLFTWGGNGYGELGNGDSENYYTSPLHIGALTNWSAAVGKLAAHGIEAMGFHAIKTDGTLWGWGFGFDGEIGNGTSEVNYSSPVQVGSDTDWTAVAGEAPSVNMAIVGAIRGGKLYTWGGFLNQGAGGAGAAMFGRGELTGEEFLWSSPTQVGALTNWAKLAACPYHMMAIKTDGTLWGWGYYGMIIGVYADPWGNYSSPVQIGSDTDWSSIVGGGGFRAIKTNGTLWSVGANYYGECGLGTTSEFVSSWTQVGSLLDWAMVALIGGTNVAIKTDGSLWTWGANLFGGANTSSPTQVGSATDWSKIYASYTSLFAIKTNGTLWSVGRNVYGVLGLGDETDRSSFTQVGSGTNWLGVATNGGYYMAAVRG